MPRTVRHKCLCGALVRSKGRTVYGTKIWDNVCWKCRANDYRMYKKTYCEICGFIAVHSVQLDVDHIDGNHNNNDALNLQTLCANCHRLKTQTNSEHLSKPMIVNTRSMQYELAYDE